MTDHTEDHPVKMPAARGTCRAFHVSGDDLTAATVVIAEQRALHQRGTGAKIASAGMDKR